MSVFCNSAGLCFMQGGSVGSEAYMHEGLDLCQCSATLQAYALG